MLDVWVGLSLRCASPVATRLNRRGSRRTSPRRSDRFGHHRSRSCRAWRVDRSRGRPDRRSLGFDGHERVRASGNGNSVPSRRRTGVDWRSGSRQAEYVSSRYERRFSTVRSVLLGAVAVGAIAVAAAKGLTALGTGTHPVRRKEIRPPRRRGFLVGPSSVAMTVS